tara:strand:+ start:467 stop:829 length:363 start_codon:yes stop_codon:yes gene_type:complete
MATLTTKLILTSTDSLSDTLSLSLSDILTTTVPSEMSRITVLHSAPTELAAASTGAHYTYIKNISSVNSKPVDIRTAGGTAYSQISTGEFAFIPAKVNLGIEVIAIDESVVVEYAIFKKA